MEVDKRSTPERFRLLRLEGSLYVGPTLWVFNREVVFRKRFAIERCVNKDAARACANGRARVGTHGYRCYCVELLVEVWVAVSCDGHSGSWRRRPKPHLNRSQTLQQLHRSTANWTSPQAFIRDRRLPSCIWPSLRRRVLGDELSAHRKQNRPVACAENTEVPNANELRR